ncbi:hypothetical protein BJV82DRAFT_662496 [Fennellomyces sp. T-0311]|nr:hypothetical protein BJV82DRAFT_662496 [Fennellomyces sp. T-0311]
MTWVKSAAVILYPRYHALDPSQKSLPFVVIGGSSSDQRKHYSGTPESAKSGVLLYDVTEEAFLITFTGHDTVTADHLATAAYRLSVANGHQGPGNQNRGMVLLPNALKELYIECLQHLLPIDEDKHQVYKIHMHLLNLQLFSESNLNFWRKMPEADIMNNFFSLAIEAIFEGSKLRTILMEGSSAVASVLSQLNDNSRGGFKVDMHVVLWNNSIA